MFAAPTLVSVTIVNESGIMRCNVSGSPTELSETIHCWGRDFYGRNDINMVSSSMPVCVRRNAQTGVPAV
ncbi:hypothetical protein PISMIDRAFT_675443 [Pisolithus microcarpus 441]|uniref:Uncharacterized protein n=1 Tax=Pisolithus microcarpus 441 TaxID=765257 RepID=A0A0C9ZBY9_9AGAM|nr:hypothetical protein PISMIDRAFT_675443 [Pisolithus microcarpus 441]